MYYFPVKLKRILIQQNWSVTIQALMQRILTLKFNQGNKFGTLRKPMFSLFDVIIFWFNGTINKIYRAWLPVRNIWNNRLPFKNPSPFVWKKKWPQLFFEEITVHWKSKWDTYKIHAWMKLRKRTDINSNKLCKGQQSFPLRKHVWLRINHG